MICGPLAHAEDDHRALGAVGALDLDVLEEAHRVDGADVGVDRVPVERLARARLDVDADRFLVDARIALDADGGDPIARRRRGGSAPPRGRAAAGAAIATMPASSDRPR